MKFDVIVIGAGHAGCEAAVASARLGCRTALITLNPERIGWMSCNPAMGGLAKGQLVKEIDALGGIMGRITDQAAIQYRRLNASKGPAVRSSRAQCDKLIYASRMQQYLATVENLKIITAEASELLVEGGMIRGVLLADGQRLDAQAVVIAAGTFLRGLMHTGPEKTVGGRLGDPAADFLSGSLSSLGFNLRRLKTGTPPRLRKSSIDYTKCQEQPGDETPLAFSFYSRPEPFPALPQVSCFITYTNEQTHQIIEEGFDRSPLFTGVIKGVGPRYCPSIEDKVKRFRERVRHQIFLEPEGLDCDEVYTNGISTSLPRDIQEKFVHSIVGLEHAEFVRYGYAVEYDCIDSTRLKATLESKDCRGLFFAGQVNGTSGYEEAGAQGLIAGINAANIALQREPFVLSRLDGYIGVLIDDLVVKGSDEPYRMFTSRAEYRLVLREDNADLRLSEKGRSVGLLSDQDFQKFLEKKAAIDSCRGAVAGFFVLPDEKTNKWFSARGLTALKDRVAGDILLRRPEISWSELDELGFDTQNLAPEVKEQVEIQIKYEGYIRRDLDVLEGLKKNEELLIPFSLDFETVPGLSAEIRGRLRAVRPETLGQASRMVGVTPAAVANLMIFLKMQSARKGVGS